MAKCEKLAREIDIYETRSKLRKKGRSKTMRNTPRPSLRRQRTYVRATERPTVTDGEKTQVTLVRSVG